MRQQGGGWGLVVDGGAAMAPRPDADLHVVPLHVEISGRLLRDGAEVEPDEFYGRLERGEPIRTSTPSPGDYLAAFRACTAESVLCITMAAGLSGMHLAATVAAGMLAEGGDRRRVEVVDTGTAAPGLAVVARAAALQQELGASLADVLARLAEAREDVVMVGALRTLRHLARSGRVPAIAATAGGLLRVRPLFGMWGGEVRRLGLARGDGRTVAALRDHALRSAPGRSRRPVWLVVCHAAAMDEALELRAALGEALPVARSEVLGLSPVMGAYTGPGMIGFALLPLRESELVTGDRRAAMSDRRGCV